MDHDADALAEIRAALTDPARADTRFSDDEIPRLEGRFHMHLVTTPLRRTTTFEEVEREPWPLPGHCLPAVGRAASSRGAL